MRPGTASRWGPALAVALIVATACEPPPPQPAGSESDAGAGVEAAIIVEPVPGDDGLEPSMQAVLVDHEGRRQVLGTVSAPRDGEWRINYEAPMEVTEQRFLAIGLCNIPLAAARVEVHELDGAETRLAARMPTDRLSLHWSPGGELALTQDDPEMLLIFDPSTSEVSELETAVPTGALWTLDGTGFAVDDGVVDAATGELEASAEAPDVFVRRGREILDSEKGEYLSQWRRWSPLGRNAPEAIISIVVVDAPDPFADQILWWDPEHDTDIWHHVRWDFDRDGLLVLRSAAEGLEVARVDEPNAREVITVIPLRVEDDDLIEVHALAGDMEHGVADMVFSVIEWDEAKEPIDQATATMYRYFAGPDAVQQLAGPAPNIVHFAGFADE